MPTQSILAARGTGLCILSIDAGGPRAISQLKILTEMMHRRNFRVEENMKEKPCMVFDMIGGVGSGGFLSILLVFFRFTAEEALEEFFELCVKVLDKQGADAQARTMALKEYIENLLEKHSCNKETRLIDQNDRSSGCKLVVPISYKRHAGSTCILRNYTVRHEQAVNLTIAEALLATLSTPPLFSSISIFKDAATFEYTGADWTLSNPTQEIISEAYVAFGAEQKVACLLSLGSGQPGVFSFPDGSGLSEWTRFLEGLTADSERKAESIESQMGLLGLYHRFNVTSGLEKSAALGPEHIMAHTTVYLSDPGVSEKMDTCVSLLKVKGGISSLEQLKHSGGQTVLPPPLPPLTRTFVMRTEPWNFVNRIMLGPRKAEDSDGHRMLVVTGIGGCGKTQLMLKFMNVYKSEFASRFFIDGSSEDRIRADIVRNVRAMGSEHSQKGFEDCLLFLSQPSLNGVRLLVYDNVDNPKLDLSNLLPGGDSCAIAITSRNHLLGVRYPDAHLQLDIMSPDEAAELLLHRSERITDKDRKDAALLAQALGCLPIALQQARSYMKQTQCSANAYLERLSRSHHKLLGRAISFQMDMQSISAYAAFGTSFGMLALRVQKFLRLLSYFHWSNFPLELVVLAAKYQFSEYEWTYMENGDEFHIGKNMLEDIFLCNGEWDVTNLDEMTVALQNYSLTTALYGVGTVLLRMHPLVHEWLQSCIPEEDRLKYQSAAILLLAVGAREEYTASMQYLGSHVMHMSPLWNRLDANAAAAFGQILQESGIIQGSLELREKVVEDLKGQLDPDNMAISDAMWYLALVYRRCGRLHEAATLQEEVLKVRKVTLGERDPETIWAASNLAFSYYTLGRLKEAETLQEEVLTLRKELLGERHPDTIWASHDLALTYHDLGRLSKAEGIQEGVLKLRREVLGERHPDTVWASANLAFSYYRLGRFKEAEVLQEEALKLRKEILGERHPDTIATSNDLALTYCNMGRLTEAEKIQEEVLKLRKEILGERHPDTVLASSNLALTYRKLGRVHEAKAIQEEVLTLRKEILGERHPETISAASNLAFSYLRLGHLKKAEELQCEVLKQRKEILGQRHPDTVAALHNLAVTYQDLGRLIEAAGVQEEVLKLRKDMLGERHPDTIWASGNLALSYYRMGRLKEAEVLQQEVLKLRKEIHGERHSDTITALNDLALTYRDLGRLKEAGALQEEVLRVRKEILGERHPDTATAMINLALSYLSLGRMHAALDLVETAERIIAETLGVEHPTYLWCQRVKLDAQPWYTKLIPQSLSPCL